MTVGREGGMVTVGREGGRGRNGDSGDGRRERRGAMVTMDRREGLLCNVHVLIIADQASCWWQFLPEVE